MQLTQAHRTRNTGRTRPRAGPPRSLERLFDKAGVRFNGDAPWDIQVRDPGVYRRILSKGSLGLGESFMDGLWDSAALDELFHRLLRVDLEGQVIGWGRVRLLLDALRHRLFNLQDIGRAFQVGEQHYDAGNDLFEAMLDPTMSYSCGYWAEADTLEQAQRNKLDLICRKLELKPGERLLDIGCGWGGLAEHAARHYGVQVLGITVSREQLKLARRRCRGLPVEFQLVDYREVDGSFDKIASVGMFEHVGSKNYPVYFDTAARLLRPDGLFLLHTIGLHFTARTTDPWMQKYIFPNGKIPSACEVTDALEGRFLIEDWHSFGPDYDRTLMAWWGRFATAWPSLETNYDERFFRMWKYYLLCCAGFFRARQGQLWQLVLGKRQRTEVYRSVR